MHHKEALTMRLFERFAIGTIAATGISASALAHPGSDGGAHHGALNEIVHELAHLDPFLAIGLALAVVLTLFAIVRLLRRKA
jgi:hypothetical protein